MYNKIYIKQLLYRRKIKLNNKKTLNDILEDFQKIEMKIIENQGEINDTLENMLQLNDCELKEKLDGYEDFIKYLDGQIEYLKKMESHYNKRRKVLENSIVKCRESMVRAFDLTDSSKIKTFNYNFSICESESWKLDENVLSEEDKKQLLDKGLAKSVFKPSLADIKSDYKDMSDEDRPDWIVIEKKKYIRVS